MSRFVGVDIGVNQVQVASLGRPNDDVRAPLESLVWQSRNHFPLPIDPMAPPPADLVDRVCECLVDRLPRCTDGEAQIAGIALPLPWIHYETTTLGELPISQATCDALFRDSLFRSPAHLRYWPVSAAPVVDGKEQQVIAATAESAACRVAQAVASVGYRVDHILPHGEALTFAARPLTSITPRAVALLDLFGGLIATNSGGHSGLCRPLPACEVTDDGAVQVERLEPWLEDVSTEIAATIRYADRLSGRSLAQAPVLLCGGVATVPGVDESMATMLGMPVAGWRYAKRSRPFGVSDPADDVSAGDPRRAVALSLAHCVASGQLFASSRSSGGDR